jgi:hypothetical protein
MDKPKKEKFQESEDLYLSYLKIFGESRLSEEEKQELASKILKIVFSEEGGEYV